MSIDECNKLIACLREHMDTVRATGETVTAHTKLSQRDLAVYNLAICQAMNILANQVTTQ